MIAATLIWYRSLSPARSAVAGSARPDPLTTTRKATTCSSWGSNGSRALSENWCTSGKAVNRPWLANLAAQMQSSSRTLTPAKTQHTRLPSTLHNAVSFQFHFCAEKSMTKLLVFIGLTKNRCTSGTCQISWKYNSIFNQWNNNNGVWFFTSKLWTSNKKVNW